MRVRTVRTITTAVIGKVDTERGTFGSGIMREIAGFSGLRTVALKEVPADGDFGWVVLIRTCKATVAGTYRRQRINR